MTIKTYFSKRAFCLPAGVVLGALAVMPMAANADTADFYTQIASGNVLKTNNAVVSNGLTATSSTGVLTVTNGNNNGEIGLGVCTGTLGTLCDATRAFETELSFAGNWSGDGGDELDNNGGGASEAITIAGSNTALLTGTFTLGSLDGTERGYLENADGSSWINFGVSGGVGSIGGVGGAWTAASTIAGSGNVWTLTVADFGLASDVSSVIFRSGCRDANGTTDCGSNNDYLVASAGFSNPDVVPIPAAAWLFGSALLGLTVVARRKQA